MLELWLFGRAQATLEGSSVAMPTRKALALLAHLAVEGGIHHRDMVAALLWPEQPQAQALASLRQALYTLRHSVLRDVIVSERHTVRVSSDELWIDVEAFDSLVVAARRASDGVVSEDEATRLERAAALYSGDFMRGFTLRDCPEFDEWQELKADEYRRKVQGVLRTLVDWYTDEHDLERGIELGRRLLEVDPYDEAEQRRLMLLQVLAGHEAAAIRQYEALVERLGAELKTEPDAETTELFEAIKSKDVHRLVRRTPAGAPLSRGAGLSTTTPSEHGINASHPSKQPRRRGRLPSPPTAFVGRRQDLHDLEDLLANPAARLITIVAPGGMGKSRLVLALAEQQMARGTFGDGVFFVPLAAVHTVGFLAQAVADAMDVKLLGREDPWQQLVRHLAGRSVLLVLDNFEHVLSGRDLVSELLANAPDLKVLVTSRERLHVQEEWLYPLWGMDVPTDALDVADVRTFSAIELFERCAKQADPHFDLDKHASDVVRVCRRLQGMPLGIELAAAWVTTIPCKDIANEIDKDPAFLETRVPASADQHRSLDAIFEYSWHQASAAARSTFQKLSVFRGGFTRRAAEDVAGATLPILASLTDMALIRLTDSGRYDIHELLRQFAEAKLTMHSTEHHATERTHAHHFADMLAELEPDLKGARQFEALDDIAADIDNVLTSWRWATRHHDVETIGSMVMGFFLYCEMRGLAQVGTAVFQQAIDALEARGRGDERAATALAKLLVSRGILRMRMGFDPSPLLRSSARVLQPLSVHEPSAYVHAANWFATGLPYEGKHAEATALLDRAEAIARYADDTFNLAWLLQTRGHNLYIAGRFLDAEPVFEKSLAAFDACGERKFKAFGLNNWSRTAINVGSYDRAASLNAEGLTIREMANDPLGTAASLIVLGRLKTRLGEYSLAQRHLDRAARLMQGSNNYQYWWMLELDALQLDIELGDHERARQRFQRSQPRFGSFSDPYSEVHRLNASAYLSYVSHDGSVARSLLERSLAMSQELGHRYSEAKALHHLGFVELDEGRFSVAREHFARSLGICHASGAAPLALDVLIGWSASEGPAKTLELLGLVQRDARATFHARQAAGKALLELSPSDYANHEVPDLWQVVNEIA